MSGIVERLLRTEIERLTSEVARLHVLCKDRFDEIERLRAELAATLQHCEACGTLTDTRLCDCTKMKTGTQRLVPFSLQEFRRVLAAEHELYRRERNLAVEMLQSAERELAAERAARIAVASPVREEGEE